MRNKVFILFIFLLCCIEAKAQRNGINWPKGYFINGPLAIARGNGVYPDTNLTAHFGIDSTTKGMILPRGLVQSMVNPQGHVGVFMYNYTDSVLYHLDGTRLVRYLTNKDTGIVKDIVGIPTLQEVTDQPGGTSTDNNLALNGGITVLNGASINGGLIATGLTMLQSANIGATTFNALATQEGAILTDNGSGLVGKSSVSSSDVVTTTRTINTTYPLQGGGDLSANRTHTLDTTRWHSLQYYNTLFAPLTRTLTPVYPLQGGGTLAADRTFTLDTTVWHSGLYYNTIFVPNSGAKTIAGTTAFTSPTTLTSTTTPQRRLAYDGTNLLDESIASNGAITYNLQGSAPTYTYQINGVTKVFITGTGQTTWTTTSEMIAQFGNTHTDKVFIVSGSGGQFPSGSSGLMFGSSYVSTIPAISVNTQFGVGSYSMTFSNINNFILNVTRLRGNFNATTAFAAYTFTIPNSTFTGQALIGYFTNNVESGMSFNPSTGSNAFTGVGSELRVRATGTWAGLARAYDVGFDAGNTYSNGTAVGYNTDQSIGIAFRNSNASARNLFMGKVGIGSTTVPTDQVEVTGNIALMAAGNKLKIQTGTNATLNTFTLTSGTATVSNTSVTANSIILIDMKTASGTALGVQYSYTISAGTSFTVTSKKADNTTETNDNSTLSYWIIN